jgi:hypothetical protein
MIVNGWTHLSVLGNAPQAARDRYETFQLVLLRCWLRRGAEFHSSCPGANGVQYNLGVRLHEGARHFPAGIHSLHAVMHKPILTRNSSHTFSLQPPVCTVSIPLVRPRLRPGYVRVTGRSSITQVPNHAWATPV